MSDRTFAERLRERIASDPSVTEAGLAVRAGLANSTVRKLLAGTNANPRVDTAMKICAALGTTIEEFMGSPRSEAERDILRLLSQLPVAQRQRLLGYAEALAAESDRDSPAADEGNPQPRDRS